MDVTEKEMTLMSLDEAILELKTFIKDNENTMENIDEKRLFFLVGNVGLWAGACIYKLKEINTEYSESEKNIVDAYTGVTNALKHSIKLVRLSSEAVSRSSVCGSGPFSWNKVSKKVIIWRELPEDIINNKPQIKAYNLYLANKDVMEGIDKIREIINRKYKIM